MSLIQKAIDSQVPLEVTYLKASDVKSTRVILPKTLGEQEYMGKKYVGVCAYCFERKDDRNFRVDRILEIKKNDGNRTNNTSDLP